MFAPAPAVPAVRPRMDPNPYNKLRTPQAVVHAPSTGGNPGGKVTSAVEAYRATGGGSSVLPAQANAQAVDWGPAAWACVQLTHPNGREHRFLGPPKGRVTIREDPHTSSFCRTPTRIRKPDAAAKEQSKPEAAREL